MRILINILREPDDYKIICDGENTDARVWFSLANRKLNVFLSAKETKPSYICLRWNYKFDKPVRVMGDKWERSYGDMEWHSLNGEIFMPWYFLVSNGNETVGCGVMVQPNSFISFTCDPSGVTAWFDVRNGGIGVELNGRELLAGTIVSESYKGVSEFIAAKEFCKAMSPNPILPKEPVYGSNNWYYAYGESSYEEIMVDTDIIVELAGQNENKPYMVIDDGWSVNRCAGPWIPNEKYGNMKKVADDIKKKGAKPGIWFRPLCDNVAQELHPEWRLKRGENGEKFWYLDPSNPEVQDYLKNIISTIKDWGYELIKHDFTTYDIFAHFGSSLNGKISPEDGWSFYDKSKTSAEIVLELYRLIRREAGDLIVIGCNTISHLCAGLVEVYRIGDDTSGKIWSRTRACGVNALAFRLCQNDSFYKIDADCVGVLEENIDWKLNRQWLDLLAKSGSPLFVSLQPKALKEEMKSDLIKAFRINSKQTDIAEPLDWIYNNQPHKWLINGKETIYDFVMDSYPVLLGTCKQPYI